MIKTLAAKNKGICSVALLTLTLLLGFISTPSLNYNQARQSAPTELISRPSSSRKAYCHLSTYQKAFSDSIFSFVSRDCKAAHVL